MSKQQNSICPACGLATLGQGGCSYCLLKLGKCLPSASNPQSYPDLPSPEQLSKSFPQLEITRLVGRGGMGAIYHARQRTLDRDVALKIIARPIADDPAFQERFTREAKTLARLSHPNIVAVYDFGTTEDGLVYLLMEFVDGVNLREAMDAGEIRTDESIQIVSEMCAALQFAHDRGVVHRDIKPENVLLNEDGVVKVADFGLAKLLSDSPANLTLTQTRQVMGTLRYMAPEQLEDPSSVDHRADVFSLGVVFYELLTGHVPHGRFELPSRVNAAVTPALDEIVMRTLDRKPPNRYQRVSEIAAELSRHTAASQSPTALPRVTAGVQSLYSQPNSNQSTYSVAFEADCTGNLAESVGTIKLEENAIEVSYRTRDNIFGIIKSSVKSVNLPLREISKLEWRPGVFGSMISLTPKSHRNATLLPNADDGQSILNIKLVDSQTAAQLVFEAAKREPALGNSSASHALLHRVVHGQPPAASRFRMTLGVLFLVIAALNILCMVLLIIALADSRAPSGAVLAIVLVPILSGGSIVVQIVGGIYCFSPYTRKMPLAAATVSMLPLTVIWPITFCVGLWAWWRFSRGDESLGGVESLRAHGQASQAGRFQTTLMYLRESRWSRMVALANVAGLLVAIAGAIAYQTGCYPAAFTFRFVSNQEIASDELLRAQTRLQPVPHVFQVASETKEFVGGARLHVWAMKWSEPQLRQALAISGKVQWAWVLERSIESNQDQEQYTLRVGGRFSSDGEAIGSRVALAAPPVALQNAAVKSVSALSMKELKLLWTSEGLESVEESRPKSQVVGLALIVEDLVEGFAPLAGMDVRGASFTLAEGSPIDAMSVQAAIRGPELPHALEWIE